MPKGFFFLICAQFASGLADNALLILGIAFLHEQGYPGWWAPLLKFAFTLSYVFMAPALGPLADAVSKSRLMATMNGLKLLAVSCFFSGLHPVLAFALVGLAASAYAPAKYGLVTETVPQHQLVRANGWLEVTVVLAVILGTASGGVLLSLKGATVMVFLNEFIVSGLALSLKTQLAGPLFTVMGIYVVAALLNWGIPSSNADYAQRSLMPMDLLRDFRQSNRILWQDRIGCLSLSVTTLF